MMTSVNVVERGINQDIQGLYLEGKVNQTFQNLPPDTLVQTQW